MQTIQDWFDAYGESHQNPTNKLFHWICVPSIFFSLIGLLMLLKIPFLDEVIKGQWSSLASVGGLLLAFGLFFFFRLSITIALGMAAISASVLWLNIYLLQLPEFPFVYFQIGVFVVAWIGQFIGHKIEGKKPSFFDDLKFLMIGPAWLLSFIYTKVGIKY